jgi:hypothetical protein
VPQVFESVLRGGGGHCGARCAEEGQRPDEPGLAQLVFLLEERYWGRGDSKIVEE